MKTIHENERGGPLKGVEPRDVEQLRTTPKPVATGDPAFRLRTILVPVDFSGYSAQALHYARTLARQFSAQLVLVHVNEPTVVPDNFGIVPPGYDETSEALAQTAKDRLASLAAELLVDCGTVKTVVRAGRTPWEVVRVAEEVGADMIVISTHGYTGLKHVLMGSNAELIVRHAPCPVLTLRHSEQESAECRQAA